MKRIIPALCLTLFLTSPVFAIDVAPRISDREIIESLAELKTGQIALDTKIDKEIANVRGDIKEIRAEIKGIQQQVNDLKESNNKRFDTLQWLLSLFITVALSIMGIMGKILWNQQKKLTQIEATLEAQKEEISFIKSLIEKLQLLIEKLLPPSGVL